MLGFLSGIKWEELLSNCSANDGASFFSNILQYSIEQFVPKKIRRPPKHPVWTNSELQQLKSAKRAAFKAYSRNRTSIARRTYVNVSKIYKRLNRQLYYAHQRKVQSDLKSNPKGFWQHVNEQRKESGLPSTMFSDTIQASSIEEIAGLFRSQFKGVFVQETLTTDDIQKATDAVPHLPPIWDQHQQLPLRRWKMPAAS